MLKVDQTTDDRRQASQAGREANGLKKKRETARKRDPAQHDKKGLNRKRHTFFAFVALARPRGANEAQSLTLWRPIGSLWGPYRGRVDGRDGRFGLGALFHAMNRCSIVYEKGK